MRITGIGTVLVRFMSSKSKKSVSTAVETIAQVISPIKFRDNGNLQLNLHVKPGAKVSRVADITENHIGLQISAPPRDGEANEEVIRYLAEIFRIKERQVSLISGQKSRDKVVLIEKNDNFKTAEDVNKILVNNQD